MSKKSERGFTLIELMIVLTIIAILTTIGFALYSKFLQNSRDSKRQSDLKFIQSALEDYHADQLYYPASVTPGNSLSSGNKTYLNKVPNDPKASSSYSYRASGTGCADSTPQKCTGYCLFAQLEVLSLSSDSACTLTSPYNYGVTRP